MPLAKHRVCQQSENSPVDCFSRWPQRLCREDPQFRTAKKQFLQIAETALNCSSLSLGELLQRLENSPVDCFQTADKVHNKPVDFVFLWKKEGRSGIIEARKG